MDETRIERDSMGAVAVPAERYWGAQTQRSLENFRIGGERMPLPLIRALASKRRRRPQANIALGVLDRRLGDGDRGRGAGGDRRQARRRVSAGRVADRLRHPDQHEHERGDREPRQSRCWAASAATSAGSSQRPRQSRPILERQLPDRDAYRRGRSEIHDRLLPALTASARRARGQGRANSPTSSRSAAPICRTRRPLHARPGILRLSPRRSSSASRASRRCLPRLYPLAQGGTAVGTGLNARRASPSGSPRARTR